MRKKTDKRLFWRLGWCLVFVFIQTFAFSQTNVATSGTGAIWQDIPAATPTSNVSKLSNAAIRDGDLTTDVVLSDVTGTNNWQAAGITWTTAQSGITSVKFYNGFTANIAQENGVFAANAKIQSSTDGTTWTDVSGWTYSPTYSYSIASSNVIYTISGATLNNIKGIRIVGQLRTAANEFQTSWAIKVKEIQVYNSSLAVTGVSVSPTSAAVNVGATTSLTATVAPSNATNQNVSWSSSNTSVATVSSTGVVTGVAAGSATITVTTQDGAKTATSAITVNSPSSSGNIATAGTGAIWQDIPAATPTSNASKLNVAAVNNQVTTVDVNFTDVTAANNWQAAGVTWATAQSGITSVKFYNGFTANIVQDNGVFLANFKLQSSTDGTTWSDVSGWTASPVYPYSIAASNEVYTFTGTTLNNVRGIRVIGQLRLSPNENSSWAARTKEVEVFAGSTPTVAVTGVSVSPTSVAVNVGATTSLTATVAPSNATNKNVSWSSSNTAVATVSSTGVVTGVAAGSATITVTTQDGAKTATSAITVNATSVSVTGVSVSPTSASVNVGATISLTATVAPSNATNKNVSWSSSNTAVATVSSTGVVTGVAAGSATITVTTQDGAKTATSAITVTTAPVSSRVNMIGMNLGNPGLYFDESIVFADAMKSSHHWMNSSGNLAATDANYWPTEDASVLVFSKPGNSSGTYKLSFDGRATVTSNIGTLQNVIYNSTTNKTTADLVISSVTMSGTLLSLDFSGTTGGVKNVKLMRPITPGSATSYATNVTFTDYFKNAIAPYKVLRSLGWVAVNWSPDSLWSDRTLWSHSHQSPNTLPGREYNWEGRGASWEGLIMLANELNKDVWVTVPAKATNDYITKLAQLFKYGSNGTTPYTSTQANPVMPPLNSNLKVYLEYSNEIWNGQFSQTGYCLQQALMAPASSPIRFDNEQDTTTLWLRFKAMRAVQMSDLFRNVYGDAEMMTKVRPVMAWQLAYGDLTNRTLSFIDRYYNKKDSRSNYATPRPVNYYFYGGGASFYWYSNPEQTLNSNTIWTSGGWDANAEFNDPWGNPYAGFIGNLQTDASWAKHYGLSYVCYEGDNHPGYQNNDEAIMAQTHWDPRMKQNTLDHLNVLNKVDCEFGNFLSPGGSGPNTYWAVLNYQNEGGLGSPQWDAINQWLSSSPLSITFGSMAPFTRPGNSYNCPNRNDTRTGSTDLVANVSPDYTSSYLFRVPSNGNYNVKIDYSTNATARLELEFNGNVIGTYNLSNTNGASTLTIPANFTASANKLYSVRLLCTNGRVTINNVIVGSGNAVANTKTADVLTAESAYSVYPNPASDYVNIHFKNEASNTISLYSINGSKVLETKSTGRSIRLDLSKYANGLYLLKVDSGKDATLNKLIINR